MKFGVHLPNSGGAAVSPDSFANIDPIKKIAVRSDELGYNAVWANEYATMPSDQTPREQNSTNPLSLFRSSHH